MIVVDTNILVYAHRRDSEWYQPASKKIRELAEGNLPWCIPWPCIHEFIAIVTHPRAYDPPTTLTQAIQQIDYWLESPSLMLISENSDYWLILSKILQASKVTGPKIHDARIAAFCILHGINILWSADRDFNRFNKQLKIINPLNV